MSKRNPCIVSVVVKKIIAPKCVVCTGPVEAGIDHTGMCVLCAGNDIHDTMAQAAEMSKNMQLYGTIDKPAELKISQMLRMALEKGYYSEKFNIYDTTSRYMCLALKHCMVEAELITLEQARDVLEYIEGLIFPNDVLSGYMLNQLGYYPTWEERVAFWYETIAVLESESM